jgi:hypothetical protein
MFLNFHLDFDKAQVYASNFLFQRLTVPTSRLVEVSKLLKLPEDFDKNLAGTNQRVQVVIWQNC